MHTLKLSVSMPDRNHPDMELRLSADELACDVLITVPAGVHMDAPTVPGVVAAAIASTPPIEDASGEVVIRLPASGNTDAVAANDAYVLGGYAGI